MIGWKLMFKYCKVQVGLDWVMQEVRNREGGGVSASVSGIDLSLTPMCGYGLIHGVLLSHTKRK